MLENHTSEWIASQSQDADQRVCRSSPLTVPSRQIGPRVGCGKTVGSGKARENSRRRLLLRHQNAAFRKLFHDLLGGARGVAEGDPKRVRGGVSIALAAELDELVSAEPRA